jgi:hypothetical protein
MKKKVRNFEVSSKSFLRQPSQMDKTIENWTSKGWTLVQTSPIKKDRYLLTFEYIPTQAEIDQEKRNQRRGCILLVSLLLICGTLYAVSQGQVNETRNANATQQAALSTQRSINRATQTLIQATTETARETEIALTPTATLTPTDSPTSTSTLSPTPLYANVNSDGINARTCPSTECDIASVVTADDQFIVLGSDGDWYWVELAEGQTAYIRADLVNLPNGVEIAFAPTLTPTTVPRTPRPTVISRPVDISSASDTEDARLISDSLFILAGGRKVESVRVANGRPNGGERAVIIAYLTTETTDVGFVDEIIDIYEAVAVAIETHELDVDSVGLVAGDAFGNAVGTIVVSTDDLLAYHERRITRSQFINRFQTTTF